MTALSLPGAALLTLLGGALFGLGWGLLIISFASTLGATLAFLLSRFLFRGPIEKRFPRQFETVNRGVEKDGAFYLFTLRLVPIFPFFMINLVMGLTRIKLTTFYWVSQLGMLPGTAVYVNAGGQLGELESLGDRLAGAAGFVCTAGGVSLAGPAYCRRRANTQGLPGLYPACTLRLRHRGDRRWLGGAGHQLHRQRRQRQGSPR